MVALVRSCLLLCCVCLACGNDERDQAGAPDTQPDLTFSECVDVSHVDATQRDDLEVIGSGFEADEGRMVRILVTHHEPTYGLGEVPIEDGSFDIYLPGVLGDYTGIAVHIDSVRDNACDAAEKFWQMTTGGASARGPFIDETGGHPVLEVMPDTLQLFPESGECSLNGIFDLTMPIACTN